MKEIYAIDASGYLYRSYFAIRNMTNSEGHSTNALFGFIRSFLKLKKDFDPDYVVAVFDGENSIAPRKKVYEEYKSNRKKMPEDLRYQIEWAKEFCDLMGIPHLDVPNYEADDTMGTIALWTKEEGEKAYLCSSDKDLCQFVNSHVAMLHTHKENKVLGPEEVEENFGVPPEKIVDYLSIVGDSSDNVPGIPGLGPKAASTLLNEYGTLENLLDHADDFKGKRKEAIEEGKEQALISKKLITIHTDVDIPLDWDFYRLKTPSYDPLIVFYQDKNFRTFAQELEKVNQDHSKEETAYHLVDDDKALEMLVSELVDQKEICFDTETTGVNPLRAELVGIGLSCREGEAWYLPCNGNLGKENVLKALKPLFENSRIGFFAHNVKYDMHILENEGIEVANISFDTIIASYILNAQQRQHSLDALSLERFGKVKTPITDLIGKGKGAITMKEVPIDKVRAYCCEDADYTFRLKKDLEKEIHERGLEKVFYEIELPLVPVLLKMERRGIFINQPFLKTLQKSLEENLESLEKEIFALSEVEFNVKSPKQLSEILIDLGIKLPKKTATGYSTSADILESIINDHPMIPLILEYRVLEKLRSTYVSNLPSNVNPKTHRIHCTFNQTVAATGRLSCQDPNLQNIPIRTEVGRKIREAFCPEKEDWSYLSLDYSQVELRLVAHLSKDPNLIEAFNAGEDIHRYTASKIFDIPLEEVTKEMRYRAKAVNFGIIYGQGPVGLSRQLGISRKEAKAFIDLYFDKYSDVKQYIQDSIEKCRAAKKAVTMAGRERLIPEIDSKNPMLKAEAERLAVNTPLQGSQADLIKLAMLDIDRLLKDEGYPQLMILQIHDALLFELPDSDAERVGKIVKNSMENIWKLSVPLSVELSVGKNWAEC